MNHAKLINQSLDKIAEKDIDLTDAVYARFVRLCPEGDGALSQASDIARGRMLAEILYAFSTQHDSPSMVHTYMEGEAVNHAALGVSVPIYAALFAALIDCVGEALGDEWDAATESAWRDSGDAMLSALESGVSFYDHAIRGSAATGAPA